MSQGSGLRGLVCSKGEGPFIRAAANQMLAEQVTVNRRWVDGTPYICGCSGCLVKLRPSNGPRGVV